MSKLKEWLMKLGFNVMGPSAVRGAILGITGWLLMKDGLLSKFGIISDAAHHTLTIHWDKVSSGMIAALPAVLAGLIKGVQYHGSNVVKKIANGGTS